MRVRTVGVLPLLLLIPSPATAAGDGLHVPTWTVVPFGLLLLAIAILPLVATHMWEHNRTKALVVLILSAPVAVFLAMTGPDIGLWVPHPSLEQPMGGLPAEVKTVLSRAGSHALLHELGQYASFLILLGSLYTITGGVMLRGHLNGGPVTNTLILAFGALLANVIGTTGASVLLIRLVLRINRGRRNVAHLPVFFIFIVSNLGGLLTPLGDPPLFLGFLNGVDFFWTLGLWGPWLVALGSVLGVFLLWDTIASLRETRTPVEGVNVNERLHLTGGINLFLLLGVLAAVLLQAEPAATALTNWLRQFFACPDLQLRQPWGECLMLLMALLSLMLTPRGLHAENGFTWGPILEVAILFVGIFITMVPALALLKDHGRDLGIQHPWQYFWITGGLSSFLDNAPTYMAIGTLAASPDKLASLQTNSPLILAAISCGAVFMGANTYIGNGPNFMVKAIAEEAGYPTPSFLGYLLYSGFILLPIFGLVTYLFFLP